MDFREAEELANLHINNHGLDKDGWRFEFDYAKRRFGQCNYTKKRITLSYHLVVLNNEEAVEQTILHEVAHAIAGYAAAHGPTWKRIAREIGYKGGTTYSEDIVNPGRIGQAPWYLVCDACGKQIPRYKRSTREFSCAKCSRGRFNRNYLLRLVPGSQIKAMQVAAPVFIPPPPPAIHVSAPPAPPVVSIDKAKGVKAIIRELYSVAGAAYTIEELVELTGKTKVTVSTAISDLKNEKYAGKEGVLMLTRGQGDKYRIQEAGNTK